MERDDLFEEVIEFVETHVSGNGQKLASGSKNEVNSTSSNDNNIIEEGLARLVNKCMTMPISKVLIYEHNNNYAVIENFMYMLGIDIYAN